MGDQLETMLDNASPILPSDPAYGSLFEDLQGNILTAHGQTSAEYYFLKFGLSNDISPELRRAGARFLLGMLARNEVERSTVRALHANDGLRGGMAPATTEGVLASNWPPARGDIWATLESVRVGSELEGQARRAGRGERAPTSSLTILLTRRGYEALGERPPADEAFQQGMAARRAMLDPDAREQGPNAAAYDSVDALVIAPCDVAGPRTAALETLLGQYARIVAHESGRLLRSSEGYTFESFGFRDGISQPIFYADTRAKHAAVEAWDGFAPLRLALVADPNGRSKYACGSYVAFQKLRQDIAGLYDQADRLSRQTGRSAEEVLEQIVGRKRNGDPLVSFKGLNDFDFKSDPRGIRCPFHAHIRKVNPRDGIREIYGPREHRIVRRGMSYGPTIDRDQMTGRPRDPKACRDQDIGLLFLCAQAHLANQFEYLQSQWSGNPNFPWGKWPGADPIAGQRLSAHSKSERNSIELEYRTPEGTSYFKGRDAAWDPVISFQGGAYFFAPSISFLIGLLDHL
jgi:Dyp-type peroxidase family